MTINRGYWEGIRRRWEGRIWSKYIICTNEKLIMKPIFKSVRKFKGERGRIIEEVKMKSTLYECMEIL
jgi:hypothetical protein